MARLDLSHLAGRSLELSRHLVDCEVVTLAEDEDDFLVRVVAPVLAAHI